MNTNGMEQKKMTRRKFLKTTAIGCGAAVVVCAGAGTLASLPPAVDFYETPSGDAGSGEEKVLVVYASKAGSTAEVAEAIAKTLTGKGLAVDVCRIGHAPDPGGYRAVIVGSCVRMGGWLPEAVKYVEKNRDVLKTRPTAFFQVCTSVRENTLEAEGCMEKVRALVEPSSAGVFAGKVDFSKLSFIDRTIAKGVGAEEGDWRDWEAIRVWAESIV